MAQDQGQTGGTPTLSPGEMPRLSVVVPVYNEADNVLPLLDEILAAVTGRGLVEVIFVDDASSDDTTARFRPRLVRPRVGGEPIVRLLHHTLRAGQSAAVRTGVKAARGEWVATLDGDGQNDPADIPKLLDMISASGGPLLVGGLRVKRRDTWSRRAAGRFANSLRQTLLRDGCSDTGCGLKLFRRDAFLDLPAFNAQHRFLPALFRAHGHATAFVAVNHRPRERGVSKYSNLNRALIGILDLFGVWWLRRRTRLTGPVLEEQP
ncbi:Dolichol-phosphate mannosyltransferase [uncultured Gammaproteobacteria bacterium]